MTEGPDIPFELAPPKRTWQEDVEAMMDADIVLYERKSDAAWNSRREHDKQKVIEWVVSQLEIGWQTCGTRCDLPVYVYDSGHWNSIRKAVLIRWGHKCASCGSEATEVHHIRPRRYGGHDHPRNLMPLCTACHADIHRLLDVEIEEAITRATAEIDGSALGTAEP